MADTHTYWMGGKPERDSFGVRIEEEFIDGRVRDGSTWGLFTPSSWKIFGCGYLGTGAGQRYVKQEDGRFMKVEG